MKKETHSLQQFTAFAKDYAANLVPNEQGATVLALEGDLGAGKTTFTQIIAKEFGTEDHVSSPTFVIMKKYPVKHPHTSGVTGQALEEKVPGTFFEQLVHIDAYRLEGGEDLAALDFEELLADPKNLVIIEWPQRIADKLPKNTKTIQIEWVSEEERIIRYE